jgi:hypothetical protein
MLHVINEHKIEFCVSRASYTVRSDLDFARDVT